MNVIEIIDAARASGVVITVTGDRLKLRAPAEPPREIVEAIRIHKPQIIEILTTPTTDVITWRDGVAGLDVDCPPPGFPPLRWERFIDDAHQFLRDWAHQAERLDWPTTAIFGVDARAPWPRIDRAGLVILLDGGRVVAIARDRAAIVTPRGARQTFYRHPSAEAEAVPVWEVAPRGAQPAFRGGNDER